jgi:hypothetical protein
MIRTANYLSLTTLAKQALISSLHDMRTAMMKESRAKRAKKPRKTRKRKMVFFSDTIEKMFNSMDEEAKRFIMEGK